MKLITYLTFGGNCKDAMTFYHAVLGGDLTLLTGKDAPADAGLGPYYEDKIMHSCLALDDAILMASDAPPDHYTAPQGMSISINLTDPAEADRIFSALGEGGHIEMSLEKTFWAQKFGVLKDKFGISWMVNCE